jgi:hypothetical protein
MTFLKLIERFAEPPQERGEKIIFFCHTRANSA